MLAEAMFSVTVMPKNILQFTFLFHTSFPVKVLNCYEFVITVLWNRTFSSPEKSIAIDQNIPGLPYAALILQTAAPQFEKLRCYFLFFLHQTHPRSNVKLFKQGVICSCPVRFDVRRCNDTKDVLKLNKIEPACPPPSLISWYNI